MATTIFAKHLGQLVNELNDMVPVDGRNIGIGLCANVADDGMHC